MDDQFFFLGRGPNIFGPQLGGIGPVGGLIVGPDGDLYGTTLVGGSAGLGTIYKVNPESHKLTFVYSFTSIFGTGVFPETPLVRANDGISMEVRKDCRVPRFLK